MKQFSKVLALYTLVLLATSHPNAFSANNRCLFKVSTAVYTELTGATNVTAPAMDSYYTVPDIVGDTYPFFGSNWTFDNVNRAVSIIGTGRIYVGIDTGFALFDGLYADTMNLIDGTSGISYKVEGTGSQKILKVQWKNMKVWSGPAGNYINVQIWMYQSSGIVEFHYGPRSANNASGYTNPVTGIYAGIWYSNPGYTTVYEKICVKETPPAIQVDSLVNIYVPNIKGVPENGTVYRFAPKTTATAVSAAVQTEELSIAPNPADREIAVTLNTFIDGDVALLDVNGREVKRQSIQAGAKELRLPVAELAPGIYRLQFQNRNTSFTRTILIRH